MRRRGGGKAKGGNFERAICRELSLWWSRGRRDDVFWRAASSGAMATVRSRKGKQTSGQHGDITSIHPSGNHLLRLFTIELKVGYRRESPFDCLDRPRGTDMTLFEAFVAQTRRSARSAGTPFWLLIWKRDRRETMVYYPPLLENTIQIILGVATPWSSRIWTPRGIPVAVLPLKKFLRWATPSVLRGVLLP